MDVPPSNFNTTATQEKINHAFNPDFWDILKTNIFRPYYLLSFLFLFLIYILHDRPLLNAWAHVFKNPTEYSILCLSFPIVVLAIWIGISIFQEGLRKEVLRKNLPRKKALTKYLASGLLAANLVSTIWAALLTSEYFVIETISAKGFGISLFETLGAIALFFLCYLLIIGIFWALFKYLPFWLAFLVILGLLGSLIWYGLPLEESRNNILNQAGLLLAVTSIFFILLPNAIALGGICIQFLTRWLALISGIIATYLFLYISFLFLDTLDKHLEILSSWIIIAILSIPILIFILVTFLRTLKLRRDENSVPN